MEKPSISKIIFIIIYFLLCFILERIYWEYFYKKSLLFQNGLQNFINRMNLKPIFKYITKSGKDWFFSYITIIIILIFTIKEGIILFTIIFFSSYIKDLLKIIFHHERPFWENVNIKIDCNSGFGHPSGHSFCSSIGYLILYYFISENEKLKKKRIFRILIFCIFLFYIFLILISRLYFGVHSLDQVIFGFSLGCGFFMLFFCVLEIQNLKNEEIFKFLNFFNVIFFTLFTLLIPFLFYFIFKKSQINFSPPDECIYDELILPKFSTLFEDAFIGSMKINVVNGELFGLLFIKLLIKQNSIVDDKFFLLNWNGYNFYKKLSSVLFILFIGFPGYWFYHQSFFKNVDNIYIILIFKEFFPLFISSFLMFGFGIFVKFKIGEKEKNNINDSNELIMSYNFNI